MEIKKEKGMEAQKEILTLGKITKVKKSYKEMPTIQKEGKRMALIANLEKFWNLIKN